MGLVETLVDGGTVTWHRRGDVVESMVDGDVVGSVDGSDASLDGQQLSLGSHRGYDSIDDAGTGARHVVIRRRAHGPISVETGGHRFRITREGLRFFSRLVTLEAGGVTVLKAIRIGSTIRVMATEHATEAMAHELGLVTVALVQTWFGFDTATTEPAAA